MLKKVLLIIKSIWIMMQNTAIVNAELNFDTIHLQQQQPITIQIIHPDSKELIQTFEPFHYHIDLDLTLFKKEIEYWVHKISPIYNKPMTLDRIDEDGSIIKGTPKREIDSELLVEQLLQQSFTGGTIELPFKITESGYQLADVPYLNEVALASYTTFFNQHQVGRSKNIELSALAIHHVIVGSGDVFSFNSIVGPREIAYGYQMAPEIVNGKKVLGIGGGICQTSSTLFNAVDQLPVKILERHHHSLDVGYVPKGRDATVSFGGLDFQFQNTTGIPFLIKAYYHPGALTVEIRTSKEFADLLQYDLLE